MELFSRNNVQKVSGERYGVAGVHTVLYLLIILFVVDNFVTFRRYLLLSPTRNGYRAQDWKIYGNIELRHVRMTMNQNPGHFCLTPSIIVQVRHLNIQRKLRKHHRGGVSRVQLPSNSININKNNLISVVTLAFYDGLRAFDNRSWKWINMGMLNARSIKIRVLAVKELITEHNFGHCANN